MLKKPIAVITPCFNEGSTVIAFLKELERTLSEIQQRVIVVVVDDSSTDNTLSLLKEFSFNAANVDFILLGLKFNLGHQGAIYQGILYANTLDISHAIIMDSDGEDDPAAIPSLLEKKEFDIVEVKRGKRSEGILFRVFYAVYKLIFRLITGKSMDFGNYCMVKKKIIESASYTSFVHLPAYLLKQKATKDKIQWDRSKRIDGKSKMSFTNLFFHAFKSFIEFAEDLLMLFVKMFLCIITVLLIVLGNVMYQKFVSNTAILGWASTLSMELITLAMLCIGFFIIGILLLNLIHQQNKKTNREIFDVYSSPLNNE